MRLRHEITSLSESEATLSYCEPMNADDAADFIEWLEMIVAKLKARYDRAYMPIAIKDDDDMEEVERSAYERECSDRAVYEAGVEAGFAEAQKEGQ